MFARLTPEVVPLDRRWRYRPVEAGREVRCWKIGPLILCHMHWSGNNSKPCHHSISSGRLPCPCTDEPIARRMLGYLPIYTQEGQREVVIVSSTMCELADKLPHAAPIILRRSNVPCTPLKIIDWPTYEQIATMNKKVGAWKPADIQNWLLHLWQDPVLDGYFAGLACTQEPACVVVDQSTPTDTTVLATTEPARENQSKPVSLIDPRRKGRKTA